MKIFVFGASGLLGSKLLKFGAKKFDILGGDIRNFDGNKIIQLDATNRNEVFNHLKTINPDVVINAINIPSVDFCEANKEEARGIIVDSTKNMIEACGNSTKVIFLSSDYVFDGKNGPYSEEDKPNPLNHYAALKLEGEDIVLKSNPKNLVVRTTILYGWHNVGRPNYVLWVIDQLKRGNRINVVSDQYGNPTFADNLAEIILELIKKEKSGIYNVVGKDYINRLDFTRRIAETFNLDARLITPVTTSELGQKAIRGPKLGLKTNKLERELGIGPVGVDESLSKMKEEMANAK